jgi:hypothetical protein
MNNENAPAKILKNCGSSMQDQKRILLSLIERYQSRQKIAKGIEENEKNDRELLEALLNSHGCPVLNASKFFLFIWQISHDEELLKAWIDDEIDNHQAKEVAILDFLHDQYGPIDTPRPSSLLLHQSIPETLES